MIKYLALLGLLFSSILFAGNQENTYQYQLKNGLKIIVRVDKRAPVVFSSIWYKVGGSYEHDGITGISHMLEHMMFKGTERYPSGQFTRIVYTNGGQLNAFTGDDFTAYYEYLSADKLPLSFELESDRMHNLLLKQEDFATEHQVVMDERTMRVDDKPEKLTRERFNAAAFINNPYHHPVAGWMTDIEHLTLTDLEKWYQMWYVPNNAILIVVGDVNPEQVLALAEKYFGPLKSRPLPSIKPRTEVMAMGEREITVHTPAQLPWIIMGYNAPSLVTAKQKWQAYALLVLTAILDAGNSSRLQTNLVRGQQIATVISVNYDLSSLYSTLVTFSGVPAQGHTITQLHQAIMQQIQALKTGLVSQQELERVKAQVIAQNVFQKDSVMNQALDIGALETVGLSWRVSDDFVKNVEAVTPAEIQAVAKKFLRDKRLTIAILQPEKVDLQHTS